MFSQSSPTQRFRFRGLIYTLSLILMVGTWAGAQTSRDFKKKADAAKKKGQYQEAIDSYSRAIAIERSAREKKKLEKKLLDAKKDLYKSLVSQVKPDTGREEALSLLIEARNLGLEGEKGRRFSKVAASGRQKRTTLFNELAADAERLVDEKRFSSALLLWESARQLDEALFDGSSGAESESTARRSVRLSGEKLEKGRELIRQRLFQEAEQTLGEAEEIYPGQPTVAASLAEIKAARNEYRRARSAGDKAARAGDDSAALSEYRRAFEIDPEQASEDGMEDLIAALRQESQIVERTALAEEAFNNGRWTKARDLFRRVLEERPDDEEAQRRIRLASSKIELAKGLEHRSSGRFDEADRAFKRATEHDSSNAEARRNLSLSRRYTRHAKDARWLYVKKRCGEALESLVKAEQADAVRYRADDLQYVNECDEAPASNVIQTLEVALRAQITGRTSDSIELLQELVGPSGDLKVHIEAYLAAAYVQQAFTREPTDQDSLRLARERIQSVLDQDPDYQLSEDLFSPRIRGVFDKVRQELEE